MADLQRVVKEVVNRRKTYLIKTAEAWPSDRLPLTVYPRSHRSNWMGHLSKQPPEGSEERYDWVMGRGEYYDIEWEEPEPPPPQEPGNPRLLWDLLLEG